MFRDDAPSLNRTADGERFYHQVYRQNDDTGQGSLRIGDLLTSPAVRRVLPRRCGEIAEDDCLAYRYFDVHAVYVSAQPVIPGLLTFEVEPLGVMWPDPEVSPEYREANPRWCVSEAKITRIFNPRTAVPR